MQLSFLKVSSDRAKKRKIQELENKEIERIRAWEQQR